MCHPISTLKRPVSAKNRSVRWMCSDARERLLAGMTAPLAITISGKTVGYHVEIVKGLGYNLYREMPNGEEPVKYYVDAFDVTNPITWECDCPNAFWVGRRRVERQCKHITALAAALKHLGII